MGDEARECMMNSERRANTMQNAMEEAKTLLEQADRARKMTEQDVIDTNETLADLTVQNQSLATSKRKLEQDLTELRNDCDESANEANLTEEKAKKAMLDEAKQNAIKWGRKMAAKLESRIRDLEAELDSEQRRLGDATKNYKKADRGIKELTFRQDEDRKNAEKMQELVEKLQNQVRAYKRQIEEAEEIAAMNLAKFRKTQTDLQDSIERAEINEQALAKVRARGRSISMARDAFQQ